MMILDPPCALAANNKGPAWVKAGKGWWAGGVDVDCLLSSDCNYGQDKTESSSREG